MLEMIFLNVFPLGSGMPMNKSKDADNIEVVIPKEIKDVVGYEWNGSIYFSRLAAMKAKANAELNKLFPRNMYSPSHSYSEIVDEYEKVIKILSEIKE